MTFPSKTGKTASFVQRRFLYCLFLDVQPTFSNKRQTYSFRCQRITLRASILPRPFC